MCAKRKSEGLSREELDAALRECAKEPVHIPGSVQPHGALISIDSSMREVRQVSANLEQLLGLGVDEALHSTPIQLLGHRRLNNIRRAIEGAAASRTQVTVFRVHGYNQRFRVLPYRSGSRVVIEFEPLTGYPERWLFSVLADWQARLHRFEGRDTLLAALARLVRDLTGHERVMVYRFDEQWHGSVIAESLADGADSYLGHHFPASDIPPQVRRLYDINRVRDIPDAAAQPVPLVPETDPCDSAPLDLSGGMVRAVAPIHQAYLATMGVGSALSIALHVRGRLWGLLACHDFASRVISPILRDALRGMAQSAAFQLELLQSRAEAELIERASDSRNLLTDEHGRFPEPETVLTRHGEKWLELFRACGVALVVDGRPAHVGRIPDRKRLHTMVEWLGSGRGSQPAWSTRTLLETPLAEWSRHSGCAGLLAVPLPLRAPATAWLLLFRREVVEERVWAGNPEKSVRREDGRLSPRQSFAQWRETLSDQCEAWQQVEIRAAIDLGSDLAALVAAGEISRLNQRLERLATHDYLTGIWNRYRMEDAIDHELAAVERYGRSCALLMFDIDHFKHFNDTFGHEAGDEVLMILSQAVVRTLRDSDEVGRWGGEEFMVLAPNTDIESVHILAERLRRTVEALGIEAYGPVTISLGAAVARPGETRRHLVDRADQALYEAKEAGRNCIRLNTA